MNLFGRKKREKETHVAVTPESPKPKKEFSKSKFYYLLWTIVSMAFYCCENLEILNLDNIKEIGFNAFFGCNLKECYKEKIVSCFGYDCLSGLSESIPSNVRKISNYI